MPTKLSKFEITATCKDYVHPWTDCTSATAGLGLHAVQESLRIYATVYFIALLFRGKIPSKDDIKKTIMSILQSTAFLSWSAFTYSMFICSIRRILGKFNILTVSYIPSFLSSFAAILLERPSRRLMLSLYVSNIATETLFRMAVWRGYISPISYGQVYIFSISIAILLYFYRSNEKHDDSIFRIIRIVIGPHEDAKNLKANEEMRHRQNPTRSHQSRETSFSRNNGLFNIVWKALNVYKLIINKIKSQSRHHSCPHPDSCLHYILSGGLKLFSYGLGVQLVLKVVFKLKNLIKAPKLFLKETIFRRENLNIAIFAGGFSGLYKLLSCTLRRFYGYDSKYYAIPAGLISSIAFVMYPDSTAALYFMWKALQLVWNHGAEKGILPEVKWFVIFLYCFSTAILFHAAIMEPQNLRISYWKFLVTISGGRIAAMSRTPLDEFGLETSKYLQRVLEKTKTTDKYDFIF